MKTFQNNKYSLIFKLIIKLVTMIFLRRNIYVIIKTSQEQQ